MRRGHANYDTHLFVDYKSKLRYGSVSSLMRGVSGDDPEGGAGSGVPRLRLVTAGSGGPGHRLGTLKLQRFLAIFRRAPRREPDSDRPEHPRTQTMAIRVVVQPTEIGSL